MKRVFALVTITGTAAAGLALLAASSFKPVQATTFPSPTLIYTAGGVRDITATPEFGTSVHCINQSGQSASIRWRFLADSGADMGSTTLLVPNGKGVSAGTDNGTNIYTDEHVAGASGFQGRVAVYSTQSAVFCTAVVGATSTTDAGNTLHMIRFNPHPGTIE